MEGYKDRTTKHFLDLCGSYFHSQMCIMLLSNPIRAKGTSVTAMPPAKNTMWTNNSENTQYKLLSTQDFTESTVTVGASAKVTPGVIAMTRCYDKLLLFVNSEGHCNLVRVSSLSSLLFSVSCFYC